MVNPSQQASKDIIRRVSLYSEKALLLCNCSSFDFIERYKVILYFAESLLSGEIFSSAVLNVRLDWSW